MRKNLRKKIEKIMPADRLLITIFALLFNCTVYYLGHVLTAGREHLVLTSRLDDRIPFVPATVSIYFACYLFWALNYVIIANLEEEKAYQFYFADFLSRIICLIIFLALPTTNIRPEVHGNGIWESAMRFLYTVDAADNLFPSIHCLVSWFCYIGIRGNAKVPKWYQRASAIAAVLVFISTLTTKQHVIIDVAAGVLIAEGTLLFAKKTKGWRIYKNIWAKLTCLLFGQEEKQETAEQKKGEKYDWIL